MEPRKTPFWAMQIPSAVTFPRRSASCHRAGRERRPALHSDPACYALSRKDLSHLHALANSLHPSDSLSPTIMYFCSSHFCCFPEPTEIIGTSAPSCGFSFHLTHFHSHPHFPPLYPPFLSASNIPSLKKSPGAPPQAGRLHSHTTWSCVLTRLPV